MRKLLHKILLIVNILFACSLLFSYSAAFVNPEVFVIPAFFGLAYPYLLLANICFAVLWIIFLKPECIISIVIILIGFTHLSNFIQLKKSKEDKEGTFMIISYNVRLFNHFEGKGKESEKSTLSFIQKNNPDIICLQEFFTDNSAGTAKDAFTQSLGNKYYSHIKLITSNKVHKYGIATYSKYKIIKRGEIIHPGSSSLTIYSDIVVDDDTIRVFNNHLQSFKLQKLEHSFLEEITSEENTHDEVKAISMNLRQGFIQRAQQSLAVREEVNKSPYPVIVAGDFNDTPDSFSYHKIRGRLDDAFVNSGYGAGFTYIGRYPSNRIDYILYSGNALICKVFDVLKINHSDHYPICSYFSFLKK